MTVYTCEYIIFMCKTLSLYLARNICAKKLCALRISLLALFFNFVILLRYATPEKFFVEPVGTKVLLVVDRVSQQIYTQGN